MRFFFARFYDPESRIGIQISNNNDFFFVIVESQEYIEIFCYRDTSEE